MNRKRLYALLNAFRKRQRNPSHSKRGETPHPESVRNRTARDASRLFVGVMCLNFCRAMLTKEVEDLRLFVGFVITDKQFFIFADFVLGYNDYSCSARYRYMFRKDHRRLLVAVNDKPIFRHKQQCAQRSFTHAVFFFRRLIKILCVLLLL